VIDLSAFRNPVVKRAYEYWTDKSASGRLPSRSDIKPQELHGLLPWLFLVDVLRAPLRFKFRLVGTELTRWAGREYTGIVIGDRDCEESWQQAFDDFRSVVDVRVPRYDQRQAPWMSLEFPRFERILAPLSSDESTVDMLFGALHVL